MAQSIASMPIPPPPGICLSFGKDTNVPWKRRQFLQNPMMGHKKVCKCPPQDSIIIALDYEWSPFFLRESRASETQARLKITSLEKGKTQRGERKMGDYRPRLVNLCIPLTTQNSYWLFHGNLSTSVKNAPAAIDTRHNHYFQNK